MTKKITGWQQPPVRLEKHCIHIGLIGAAISILSHAEGDEWICTCGTIFSVAYQGDRIKRLVEKGKINE